MIFERALRKWGGIGLALVSVLWLASCGSGAVGDNTATSGPLAVIPASATVYSGVPTLFAVSGGTGNFTVVSSDQIVIPNPGSLSGTSFSVVANSVGADTPVTLTVRDTAGTQATVALTVKPRTVGSSITITPTSSQSAICGVAICSGGDAEVAAVLSQNGVPFVGRPVLFEAISGDFRFITSPPGAPETLATSLTTSTDSTGTARVRIRVLASAAPQTALLQITDTVSGAFQRASFTIAVANTAELSAQPSEITFRGRTSAECASNVSADVIVVGGRPPYSISNPGSFLISPTVVTSSGGRFTVTATGQCVSDARIAVVDSLGASTVVTVTNELGPLFLSNQLVVAPTSVTLGPECNAVASVLIAGGVGNYMAVSSDPDLVVSIAGNTASIRRTRAVAASKTVPIAISDGREIATVSVAVSAAPCP